MLRENYLSRTASPIQESHAFFIATTAKDATRAISHKEGGANFPDVRLPFRRSRRPADQFRHSKTPKTVPMTRDSTCPAPRHSPA